MRLYIVKLKTGFTLSLIGYKEKIRADLGDMIDHIEEA